MYRTTYDLNEEEFEELRDTYFYEVYNGQEYDYVADVPDEVIHNHYNGISFVEEDFWCNV